MSFPMGMPVLAKLNSRDLDEGYNLEAAKLMRPVLRGIPLAVVGGWRTLAKMEETLERGFADCISMSRPFIRDPFLVKKFREGRSEKAGCVSCNRCLAAVANNLPVHCYQKNFPRP